MWVVLDIEKRIKIEGELVCLYLLRNVVKQGIMKIGDVVISRKITRPLHSGCFVYSHAIVVQVEPMVLISEEADMRWDCLDRFDLIVLCQAHPDIVKKCMIRFQKGK